MQNTESIVKASVKCDRCGLTSGSFSWPVGVEKQEYVTKYTSFSVIEDHYYLCPACRRAWKQRSEIVNFMNEIAPCREV